MDTQNLNQPVCMGCQSSMASPLFCFACNSLQRLNAKVNYFEVFGLPYTYELNLSVLEERYQELASELHPDFYATAPDFEQHQSEESSTLLNTAYQTLKDASSRADYLLKLLAHNHSLDERELPKGFLEEMFFLQESLEELLQTGDNTSELDKIRTEFKKRLKNLEKEYSTLFHNLEFFHNLETGIAGELDILQKIQTCLNAEKYLKRLLENSVTEK